MRYCILACAWLLAFAQCGGSGAGTDALDMSTMLDMSIPANGDDDHRYTCFLPGPCSCAGTCETDLCCDTLLCAAVQCTSPGGDCTVYDAASHVIWCGGPPDLLRFRGVDMCVDAGCGEGGVKEGDM